MKYLLAFCLLLMAGGAWGQGCPPVNSYPFVNHCKLEAPELNDAFADVYTAISPQALSSATYGAVCNGVTDDTVALQAWLDDAVARNRVAWLQELTSGCIVSQNGSNPYALRVNAPITIMGQRGKSIIRPAATIGATVNILSLFGAAAGDYKQTVIDGILIGNPLVGESPGNHRIYFDTQVVGASFQAPIVQKVYLQSSSAGGYGIYHLNNNTNNPSGGLRGALFGRGSYIGGGIGLEGSGDSVNIAEGTFRSGDFGTVNVNPCVYANLAPDAAGLTIRSNNMSCANGQIVIDRASIPNIFDNELEQAVTNNESNKALVDLRGTTASLLNPRVTNNAFIVVAAGATGNPVALRIGSAVGAVYDANSINVSGVWTPVIITASATGTQQGCVNTINAGGAAAVNDSGTATITCGLSGSAAFVPAVTSTVGTFTTVSAAMLWNRGGYWVDMTMTITITTNGTAAGSIRATLPIMPTAKTAMVCWQNPSSRGVIGIIGPIAGQFVELRFGSDGLYPGADGVEIVCSGRMGVA